MLFDPRECIVNMILFSSLEFFSMSIIFVCILGNKLVNLDIVIL
jgi:hypothetical protein